MNRGLSLSNVLSLCLWPKEKKWEKSRNSLDKTHYDAERTKCATYINQTEMYYIKTITINNIAAMSQLQH